MVKYLYDSCIGTYYSSSEEKTHEQAYCGICGDSDTFVGTYETDEEKEKLIREWNKC